MAEPMIQYQWATGECLTVSFDVEDSFPDACAEAEAAARRLFAYGMGVVRAYDQEAATDEAGE